MCQQLAREKMALSVQQSERCRYGEYMAREERGVSEMTLWWSDKSERIEDNASFHSHSAEQGEDAQQEDERIEGLGSRA